MKNIFLMGVIAITLYNNPLHALTDAEIRVIVAERDLYKSEVERKRVEIETLKQEIVLLKKQLNGTNQSTDEADQYTKFTSIGIESITINDEITRAISRMGITNIPFKKGVMVTNLGNNSPAFKSGINVSDCIISINNKNVSDVYSFTALMSSLSQGDDATITVYSVNGKTNEKPDCKKNSFKIRIGAGFPTSTQKKAYPIQDFSKLLSLQDQLSTGLYKLSDSEIQSLHVCLEEMIKRYRNYDTAYPDETSIEEPPSEKGSNEKPKNTDTATTLPFDFFTLLGANIISDDNTFLGTILLSEFDKSSIMNKNGEYGDKYSKNSIFNEYGKYGGEYSKMSPFNPYTSNPPKIFQGSKFIAFLTVNKTLFPRVDPQALTAWLISNN